MNHFTRRITVAGVGLAWVAMTTGCAALLPTPIAARAAPRAAHRARQPAPHPALAGYTDLRGAIHLHTDASHDGTTPLPTVVRLATSAGLDFIVITDHNTLAQWPHEQRTGRPLVLVGDELSTSAGFLLALFIQHEISRDQPVEQILEQIHHQGGLAIVANPTARKRPWTRWDLAIDGLEIFDFNTMFRAEPAWWLIVKTVLLPNPLLWHSAVHRPDEPLALWDRELARRPLIGIAGHDVHAHLRIGPWVVDSFSGGFQTMSTHVLATAPTAEALAEGLRHSRCYVAFDGVGDPTPFLFAIQRAGGWALMGDHVRWDAHLEAVVEVPQSGTIALRRNGHCVGCVRGRTMHWTLSEPGVYRIEVMRRSRLWIISNPIYIEKQPQGLSGKD